MRFDGFANASGGPRDGQWCRLLMADPDKLTLLKTLGAHTVAVDGREWVVGIAAKATRTLQTMVERRDGTKEPAGGVLLPNRVVVQRPEGANLDSVRFNPATRSNETTALWFAFEDADVALCEPVVSKDHFPPGYVATTFAGEHAGRFTDPSP